MLNRRGQNIAEYSILIALVIAAAVAMNTYVKRGLQGRMKDAVDHVGTAAPDVGGSALTFTGQAFEPTMVTSDTNQNAQNQEQKTGGLSGQYTKSTTESATVTGTETVAAQTTGTR